MTKGLVNKFICGYTCMDHDRLMTNGDERKLLSLVIELFYHRVGVYLYDIWRYVYLLLYPDVYVRASLIILNM